jgi:hypothetical protein
MKNINYILFTIILSIAIRFSYAQNLVHNLHNVKDFIVIKGKITTDDMLPIAFANVINLKEKSGTQADKNGEYELIINKPTTISVSYVGFQTNQFNILQNMFNDSLNNDTLTINIILKIAINELKTVEVIDEKIKLVYDKPNVDILDYEFNDNNNIILLVEENKKYKLRLMTPDADSIIKDKILNFNAENFYVDCFDNMHILSKDSSYQMYIKSSEIYIYKGISIKEFNTFLLPCLASTSEYLFFQQWGSYNQSVIYSTINKTNKNFKLLMSIKNAESENFANGEIKRINELKNYGINDMGDLNASSKKISRENSTLEIARENQNRIWFYNAVLTKQTYHPLKIIRDSIFIFNHITDTAYVYNNSGELKRT